MELKDTDEEYDTDELAVADAFHNILEVGEGLAKIAGMDAAVTGVEETEIVLGLDDIDTVGVIELVGLKDTEGVTEFETRLSGLSDCFTQIFRSTAM